MNASLYKFPARYDIRISHQRRRFRAACPLIDLAQRRNTKPANPASEAYRLYCEASTIDEDPTNLDRALSLYTRALQLDPSLSIAHTNIGNIHFRRHNNAAARVAYETALSLDPTQPEALYNLGYIELESGNVSESILLFRRALQADPRFADAWFNLAMALEQAGKPAQLEWQRYLSLEPNHPTWSEIARRHMA